MTTRNALFSAIHFLLVVATLSMGGFCLALGCVPHVRYALVHMLTDNPDFFLFLGMIILGIAALLLYAFYFLNRLRYFQLRMGVDVDPKLVTQLVQGYVTTLFPKETIPLEVQIHSNQMIEVVAEFPHPSKELLERIEKELSKIFSQHLKYNRPFILTVAST